MVCQLKSYFGDVEQNLDAAVRIHGDEAKRLAPKMHVRNEGVEQRVPIESVPAPSTRDRRLRGESRNFHLDHGADRSSFFTVFGSAKTRPTVL